MLVIVDVLSFSTAVNVAVSQGAVIYPFSYGDQGAAQVAADQVGALLAKPRRTGGGQLSLSPASLRTIPYGTKLMLPSPNGSRLSLAAGGKPVVAGCLRNAGAAARLARKMAGNGLIGVIPAGERWPDGSLRPAIEDLLGAGAIVQHLDMPCSPEAQVARNAFRSSGDELALLVRGSVSGQELAGRGYTIDVDVALELGVSDCAPLLSEGAYRAA